MHKYRIITLSLVTFLLSTSHELAGQQKSEAVSKVVSKDLKVHSADALYVIGEKANIHVTGWKNSYISLKITFSATHTDNKIALRELDFMKYSVSRENNVIELRNAFILPSSQDQIQSKLEVTMDLMVPSNNGLSLTNKYGNIEISKMTGKVIAKLEFSDMTLNSINGEIILNAAYSEIRGYDIAVNSLTCDAEKSQVSLDLSNGIYKFNSRHSDLDLTLKDIRSLTVSASRTNITVRPLQFESYDFKLLNKEGKIYAPIRYSNQIKSEGKQNSLLKTSVPAKPLIQITTNFNTITIK